MISSDLKIQSLTTDNLTELLELDKACFDGLWTMQGYLRELESPNSHFLGLFSPFNHSELLGMGCFWSILEEAHITILAVHPPISWSRTRKSFIVLSTANCYRSWFGEGYTGSPRF